jgi:hypothetical protein
MKAVQVVRATMVSMALVSLCVPSVAFAIEPAAQPAVIDIALADGGTLHGRAIDLQGGEVTGIPVSLQTQDQRVVSTTTAKDGRFVVQGLRGGVYQVAVGQGHGTYRLWSPGTAPPSALNDAVVYTDGEVKKVLTNPFVMGCALAAAVAIPLALSSSHSASP